MPTRVAAKRRCRVCFGLSLLSAGTPMFFMGEEVGAQNAYKVHGILTAREDILGERNGTGKSMFRLQPGFHHSRLAIALNPQP